MNKNKDQKGEHKIVVGIPVVLEKANVVFNMDHLAFAGDVPVGINYMHLLANRFREMNTKGQIVGVFHGDAAYMTLNDEAYLITVLSPSDPKFRTCTRSEVLA